MRKMRNLVTWLIVFIMLLTSLVFPIHGTPIVEALNDDEIYLNELNIKCYEYGNDNDSTDKGTGIYYNITPVEAYQYVSRFNTDHVIFGTDGDDDIIVPNNHENHIVFALGGNDTITIHGGGNNRIYGMSGNNIIRSTHTSNNIIDPGTGNNRIYGGWGIDTYVIGRGYGLNWILPGQTGAGGPTDRLVFRDDIRQDEVFFIRRGNDLEVVVLDTNPLIRGLSTVHLIPMELITDDFDAQAIDHATNRITFSFFFTMSNRRFLNITFPDGSVVYVDDILNLCRVIYGTDGDDIISTPNNHDNHIVFALGGNDTITVNGSGNNRIYGMSGNNVIHILGRGNNIIDPGTGNNRIYGTWGINTYVIGRGYGLNRIVTGPTGIGTPTDRLIFKDDIRKDEVFFIRRGNDLEVVVLDINPFIRGFLAVYLLPMELITDDFDAQALDHATNRITFIDFFRFTPRRFVDITFPDGSVVCVDDILNLSRVIFGTDGDDDIIVPNNHDNHIAFALGGNDTITMHGSGNNRIYGMSGNNVIRSMHTSNNIIDPGTGNNRIYGGWGIDTYVIGRGYGINRIVAGAHNSFTYGVAVDKLIFRDGITQEELIFNRVGNNMEITIKNDPGNKVILVDYFRFAQRQPVNITFIDRPIPNNTGLLYWPTSSMEITLWYGQLDHLSQVRSNGLNVQGAAGSNVFASANAVVTNIENNRLYLNFRLNGVDMQIVYGNINTHLRVGDIVNRGNVVGAMMEHRVGLHNHHRGVLEIELWQQSALINPAPFFDLQGMTSDFLHNPMSSFFERNATQGFSSFGMGDVDEFGVSIMPATATSADVRFALNLDLLEGELYLRRFVEYLFYSLNLAHYGYTMYNTENCVLFWCENSRMAIVNIFGYTLLFMSPEDFRDFTTMQGIEGFSNARNFGNVIPLVYQSLPNNRMAIYREFLEEALDVIRGFYARVILRYALEKNGGLNNSSYTYIGGGHFHVRLGSNYNLIQGTVINGNVVVRRLDVMQSFRLTRAQVGHASGDHFRSRENAVLAWALTYHPLSIPMFGIQTPSGLVDFPEGSEWGAWIMRFDGIYFFSDELTASATHTHRPGYRGFDWTSLHPRSNYENQDFTVVASIHTHPNFPHRPHPNAEYFGRDDVLFTTTGGFGYGLPSYLVTPRGYVRRLEPGTWTYIPNTISNYHDLVSTRFNILTR